MPKYNQDQKLDPWKRKQFWNSWKKHYFYFKAPISQFVFFVKGKNVQQNWFFHIENVQIFTIFRNRVIPLRNIF